MTVDQAAFQGSLNFSSLTSYQLIDTLSIDRIFVIKEEVIIKLHILSDKKEVTVFLEKLKTILYSDTFDIENDLTIIKSKKKKDKEQFSTPYTLVDLDYDVGDVVDRLKELTVEEYSETLVDRDDLNPPLLFVFGKAINNKQVYIKLKIKGNQKKHILCVSFHYAEEKMSFPYT